MLQRNVRDSIKLQRNYVDVGVTPPLVTRRFKGHARGVHFSSSFQRPACKSCSLRLTSNVSYATNEIRVQISAPSYVLYLICPLSRNKVLF
jgi:hypothetical protein